MVPFVLALCAVGHYYTHTFLPATEAFSFASRWRPQLVAGHIFSTSGMDAYVRARISLRDPRCTGAVLQNAPCGRPCLYVLHRDTYDQLHIACILWHPSRRMMRDMKAFRSWYDRRFMDDIFGDTLPNTDERKTWDLTSYEA